jgi:tRNA A37 threonylcarbamoyladenosine synthetase subunit TsaC/SUA5/YrdC
MQPTTVIDLTGPEPVILRVGRGEPARLGLRVDAAAQA